MKALERNHISGNKWESILPISHFSILLSLLHGWSFAILVTKLLRLSSVTGPPRRSTARRLMSDPPPVSRNATLPVIFHVSTADVGGRSL